MSIDSRTKKVLWGKSGGKCAFCRADLIIEGAKRTDTSVVGEVCHIHSSKPNGPRYDNNYSTELLDTYDNLILFCAIHHKLIDDQCDTYTSERLTQMKTNHEAWVAKQLSVESQTESVKIKQVKENIPSHLQRITSGKQFTSLLDVCFAIEYSYDDALSEQEIFLISNFLQDTQDFLDIYSDLNISKKISFDIALNDSIKELDINNIWVFAARENRIVTGGVGADENFPVLIMRLLKKNNACIMKVKV